MATTIDPSVTPSADPASLFQQIDQYPWSSDPEFQQGLASILNPSNQSIPAAQAEDISLSARCFYFSRKHGVPVDPAAYKAWKAGAGTLGGDTPTAEGSARPVERPTRTEAPSEEATASPPAQAAAAATRPPLSSPDTLTVASDPSSAPPLVTAAAPEAPYPTSFARIVELITKGEPIPGVKTIPGIVLEGKESESVTARRKKPWEKDGEGLSAT